MRPIIRKRYTRQLLSGFFTLFTAMEMIDRNSELVTASKQIPF